MLCVYFVFSEGYGYEPRKGNIKYIPGCQIYYVIIKGTNKIIVRLSFWKCLFVRIWILNGLTRMVLFLVDTLLL